MSQKWIRFIFDLVMLFCILSMPIMQWITIRLLKAMERRSRRIEQLLSVWAKFYGGGSEGVS